MPEIIVTIDTRIADAGSLDRFARTIVDSGMTMVGAVNPGRTGSPYRRNSDRSSVLAAIGDASEGNKGLSLYANGMHEVDLEPLRTDLREQGLAYRIETTSDEDVRTSVRWMPGFVGEIAGVPMDDGLLYSLEDVENLLRLADGDFALLKADRDASERMTFQIEVPVELLPAPAAPGVRP